MESWGGTKKCPKWGSEMELFPVGRNMTHRCNNCGNEENLVTM